MGLTDTSVVTGQYVRVKCRAETRTLIRKGNKQEPGLGRVRNFRHRRFFGSVSKGPPSFERKEI